MLDKLKHTELVTWAVYLLGGDQRRIDTEEVAVKAFQLAPHRLAWRKYPEQINLELVRVYLSNAKKAEHGSLLAGSGRTGWSLTQKGLMWVKSSGSKLKSMGANDIDTQSRAGSVDASRIDRERKRIMTMPAWIRWSSGDRTAVLSEAREVFRIDSYSTASVREAKLTRLRSMFVDDEDLNSFLSLLSKEIAKEETINGASG